MHYKTLIDFAKIRETIPVLEQISVSNGVATATDMDVFISVPTDIKNGMYYPHGFDSEHPIPSKIPQSDFPDMPDMGELFGATVLKEQLIDDLEWVLKAASTEETRYYLNGVYFDEGHVIATDGHRMHYFEHAIAWGDDKKVGGILPKSACRIILNLVKEIGAKCITFEFFDMKFKCYIGKLGVVEGKLIDGTFPAWQKVVPDHADRDSTDFNPDEIKSLLPDLKNVDAINGNNNHLIRISDGKAIPTNNHEDIDRSWPVSPDWKMTACFNTDYLCEMPAGKMYYGGAGDTFIVIANDDEPVQRYGVIMPCRVD